MWVVFPPGEAHMSRILSPGCGSRTCVHTMEGRFWAKIKSGRRSLTQGASYRGSVIKIPTPLEKISIKLANRNLFRLVKKIMVISASNEKFIVIFRVNVVSILSTLEQVYSHIYVYSLQRKWNYEFLKTSISIISNFNHGLLQKILIYILLIKISFKRCLIRSFFHHKLRSK